MGKESKLRNPRPDGTRYEYSNGDRKLYDRDKMPEGLDSDIWHLVLCFEQYAEAAGYSVKRHVAYTELYHRVSKDPDLRVLLSQDTQVYTRARVTTGICGTHDKIVHVLELMIEHYWEYIAADNNSSNIDEFCSMQLFNYIKQQIIDTLEREELITTGIRETVAGGEVKPSRRTEQDKRAYEIISRVYSEQEIGSKIEHWQRDNRQPS